MAEINHVGLIPDGNRRWAVEKSLGYPTAYKFTAQNLLEFIEYLFEKEIGSISIYMLSKENLKRRREDLEALLEAETNFIVEMLPDLCRRHKCRVIHAGNPEILPADLVNGLNHICRDTSSYGRYRLYLLLGYNPFEEINMAIASNRTREVTIEDLWVPEDVDLVIRTAGGPTLLSNFLPLQCGYAQIYMVSKYFNDFTVEDFDAVYEKAVGVEMLYGK